jgi:DNA polymerase delta subunit 1
MILQTKNFVEAQGFTVIYGDTDSVMVNTGHVTMAESFVIAKRLAVEATRLFPDTVQLEFEKVFFPYLLIKKKMYAGMKYEDAPGLAPKLDVKGLAVVRRDNCKFLRDILRNILYNVMRDNNPAGAYEVVRLGLEKLMTGAVPLSDLEISKSLRGEYKDNKQQHLTVVAKMKLRKEIDIPQMGDRVPFVILQKPINCTDERIFLRAEHPKHATLEGLRVDWLYYLENQLKNHILKIMDPLPVPSVQRLFDDAVFAFRRERLGVRNICSYFSNIHAGQSKLVNVSTSLSLSTTREARPTSSTASNGQKTLLGKTVTVKRAKATKRARSPERPNQTLNNMFFNKK